MDLSKFAPHVAEAFRKFGEARYQDGLRDGKQCGRDEVMSGLNALRAFLPPATSAPPLPGLTSVGITPVMLSQPPVETAEGGRASARGGEGGEDEFDLDGLVRELAGADDPQVRQQVLALAWTAVVEAYKENGKDPAPVLARLMEMARGGAVEAATDPDAGVWLAWQRQSTKTGGVKAVWDATDGQNRKPLYGKSAESALRGQEKRSKQTEARARRDDLVAKLDPASGELFDEQDWDDFSGHLENLTGAELKELRQKIKSTLQDRANRGLLKAGKNKQVRVQNLQEGVKNLIQHAIERAELPDAGLDENEGKISNLIGSMGGIRPDDQEFKGLTGFTPREAVENGILPRSAVKKNGKRFSDLVSAFKEEGHLYVQDQADGSAGDYDAALAEAILDGKKTANTDVYDSEKRWAEVMGRKSVAERLKLARLRRSDPAEFERQKRAMMGEPEATGGPDPDEYADYLNMQDETTDEQVPEAETPATPEFDPASVFDEEPAEVPAELEKPAPANPAVEKTPAEVFTTESLAGLKRMDLQRIANRIGAKTTLKMDEPLDQLRQNIIAKSSGGGGKQGGVATAITPEQKQAAVQRVIAARNDPRQADDTTKITDEKFSSVAGDIVAAVKADAATKADPGVGPSVSDLYDAVSKKHQLTPDEFRGAVQRLAKSGQLKTSGMSKTLGDEPRPDLLTVSPSGVAQAWVHPVGDARTPVEQPAEAPAQKPVAQMTAGERQAELDRLMAEQAAEMDEDRTRKKKKRPAQASPETPPAPAKAAQPAATPPVTPPDPVPARPQAEAAQQSAPDDRMSDEEEAEFQREMAEMRRQKLADLKQRREQLLAGDQFKVNLDDGEKPRSEKTIDRPKDRPLTEAEQERMARERIDASQPQEDDGPTAADLRAVDGEAEAAVQDASGEYADPSEPVVGQAGKTATEQAAEEKDRRIKAMQARIAQGQGVAGETLTDEDRAELADTDAEDEIAAQPTLKKAGRKRLADNVSAPFANRLTTNKGGGRELAQKAAKVLNARGVVPPVPKSVRDAFANAPDKDKLDGMWEQHVRQLAGETGVAAAKPVAQTTEPDSKPMPPETSFRHHMDELRTEKHHVTGMVPLAELAAKSGMSLVEAQRYADQLEQAGEGRYIEDDSGGSFRPGQSFRPPPDSARPDRGTTPPESDVRSAVADYLKDGPKQAGMVSIPGLRRYIAEKFGATAASQRFLNGVLNRMDLAGDLRMVETDDRSRHTADELAGGISASSGHLMYLKPKKKD